MQRVLQLAPDPASAKAGQGLASPRKWVTSGYDTQAVWGECQGSGSKPYQTQVELAGPAFKCSCPSRKSPCKHGLGLMLQYAGDQLTAGAPPQWVSEWLQSRSERAEKKQAKVEAPPKPVDEAAQAKRKERRAERIAEGLAALKLWIEDLVRGGVATAPSRGYAFFDEPSRRLIDAQAPGLARRVQALANLAAAGADWQRPFVEELASLHLLIAAHERGEALPETTRHDIAAVLGLPVSTEELAALPAVRDRWQVVAQEQAVEDRLRVQRTWLFGSATRRPALVLAFAHGVQPLDTSLPAGFAFEGDVVFYPGNAVRAAVRTRETPQPMREMDGVASLDLLCDLASDLRARQPWVEEFAAPLRNMTPVKEANRWTIVDADGRALPAVLSERAGWLLLAISGGAAVDLVATFDGRVLRPLTAYESGTPVMLAAPQAEALA